MHLSLLFLCVLCALCGLIIPIQPELISLVISQWLYHVRRYKHHKFVVRTKSPLLKLLANKDFSPYYKRLLLWVIYRT